jgi:glucokinase
MQHSGSTSPAQQVYTIGIDIGGTKMCGALVNGAYNLLNYHEIHTPKNPTDFLAALLELTNSLQTQALKEQSIIVQSVGIATAGIVDSQKGRILGATGNLPGMQGLNQLRTLWSEYSTLPLHLENDANAAAYGELVAGAAKGCQDVLMITLGTGVGVGFVIEGRLVRGAHFSAGEGGHIAVSMAHDRLCTCGKWDCWETYASGTGLAETARRMLHSTPNAQYSKMVIDQAMGGIDAVTTHHVIAAWKAGDPLATEIMDAWHTHISVGLGSLINVLDPQRVVVGGGMAQFVNFTLLSQRTRQRMMLPKASALGLPDTEIVPALLDNRAGLVGAAALAVL